VEPAELESHLSGEEVAAYLDRAVSESARARIEAHLDECDSCRDEVVDVWRLLRRRSATRRWLGGVGIAAAAAAVVLTVQAGGLGWLPGSTYREDPGTSTASPMPIAPLGTVPGVHVMTWTSVPRADRYRVRLFDAGGAVLWETVIPDTSTAVPPTVVLTPAVAYYWKVEARTGFDRWAASELMRFTIASPRE
jgi:putative zinc finger protein